MLDERVMMIPVGTRVVSRVEIRGADGRGLHPAGVVGVVVAVPVDPLHAYRVKFPDGFEAALKRGELVTLKDYQRRGIGDTGGTANREIGDPKGEANREIGDPKGEANREIGDPKGEANREIGDPNALAEYELKDYVIFQCVIGSRAYGLEHEGSDTDRRGVYLPPAELEWSLFGVPEQLENKETEECYWELQKFLVMALKANPNVLECLWSPLVEKATPLALEMLEMRGAFLSKLAYQTYNGYVMSQFKKLTTDLRNKGEVKWKHVMHLVRLLMAGVTVLREGTVPVRVEGAYRERLLAIKRGEVSWEEVNGWRVKLHEEFEGALAKTVLPERPDYGRVNGFLVRARRSMS